MTGVPHKTQSKSQHFAAKPSLCEFPLKNVSSEFFFLQHIKITWKRQTGNRHASIVRVFIPAAGFSENNLVFYVTNINISLYQSNSIISTTAALHSKKEERKQAECPQTISLKETILHT